MNHARVPAPPILLALGCLLISATVAPAGNSWGWTLVWADEFSQPDGSSPDASKWTYDTGGGGWGNAESEYYTSRTNNARVEGGKLVIEARAESYQESQYTSARMKTQSKASWTYGRIEARIQLPRGQGIWPAFWMLGADITSVGWPACGEIDIMENVGYEPSLIHGTAHGPGYSGASGIGGPCPLSGGGAFADGFHTYAVEWTPNSVKWLLDGRQYFALNPAKLPSGATWVFNKPHFIVLNVAVGGYWPGYPDSSTVFPQRMLVDYVRVYSATNLVSCDDNLLSNPGFESASLMNWTTFGAGFNTVLETIQGVPVHNDTNVFKVFGQFNSSANDSGVYQDLPAAPGQTLAADGWLCTPYGDAIAGGANTAWLELTFRDIADHPLALYRSAMLNSDSSVGVWLDLGITNQLDPTDLTPLGSVTNLVAPPGTALARYRLVFRQPPTNPGGAVLADDLKVSTAPIPEAAVAATAANLGDGVGLTFPTYLNLNYVLHCANDLANPSWSVLTNVIGTGSPHTLTNIVAGARRFFRIARSCP